MKTAQLTQEQATQIKALARQIRLSRCAEFDRYDERGDYFYLYQDIIQELNQKNKDIIVKFYDFVELMREADGYFYPEEAFLAGIQVKAEGKDYNGGLMDYFRQVNDGLNGVKMSVKKQELFDELCAALGETRGLMTEFVEDYTKYTHIEVYFIEAFYKRGYETGAA